MRLSTAIILAALLASGSAMGQNMSQMGNRGNRAPPVPAELFVIPQAWSTDQGDPEIACYHYDKGPYRDRLIDWCLAKVRGAK